MQETLQKYCKAFKKLRRGVTIHGLAPHKPILLLSVLQAVQNKLIGHNQIYITPELICLFKSNWNSLVKTNHVCNFALPFFHLSKEKTKFWHIIPKDSFGSILLVKESVSSLNELNAVVDFAKINEDLFELSKNQGANKSLQIFLLDKYFSETKDNFDDSLILENDLFKDIENKLLNESREEYRKEINHLIQQKDEEEIFLRGCIFKREIPKIYNYTCCISGMRIDATASISMIDACHIVPFSVSYDDTVTNGIALCPNLHRAFDRGLIGIDENYKVVISSMFKENENSYSIKAFENREISLPILKTSCPIKDNFEWHRINVFK